MISLNRQAGSTYRHQLTEDS